VATHSEANRDLPQMSVPSDRTLLQRFEGGEQDAATAIYLRYAKRLQLLATAQAGNDLSVRIDPEDVVQSVFRTFFRRAAEGHYVIPDGEELWKLFLVIALNKVRALGEHHRAAKRDVSRTTDLGKVVAFVPDNACPDEAAYRVLHMTVNELLDALPDAQLRMVEMRIEGHDVRCIADATKRAKRTVERVLQNFRRRLAAALEEE
jgi:RNA polymerase sigma-70 factor (ECF subfamily)